MSSYGLNGKKLSIKIDHARVTQAALTDLDDFLHPTGPRTMPMPCFDDEFVDIVDYILRITYWIWHEKKGDLCTRYYAADSVLHTMTGDIIGNQPVVENTWKTLEAFPDRTFDGENVIWSVEDDTTESVTYYSSHLIVTAAPRLLVVDTPPHPEKDVESFMPFMRALFASVWQERNTAVTQEFYNFRVSAHLTAGRELYGALELKEYLTSFQEGLENIRVTVDHVAQIPYMGDGAIDVAVRWSMTAIHAADSALWGPASQTRFYVLGGSHYRIVRHKIREEWTVFDELAIHRQIATNRLLKSEEKNSKTTR